MKYMIIGFRFAGYYIIQQNTNQIFLKEKINKVNKNQYFKNILIYGMILVNNQKKNIMKNNVKKNGIHAKIKREKK